MRLLRTVTGTVRRTIVRHKAAAAVLVACVACAVAAGTVAAGTGHPARAADPPAPSFTVSRLGDPSAHVSLSQYVGRPVVINFFASWCGPCRKETPLLARFYRAEHGRVAIVGLDENDAASAASRFVRSAGVTYPVGFDPSVAVGSAYGVTGIPQTFFLDAAHRIVKRVYGAVTLAELRAGTAEITGSRSSPG